MDADHPRIGFCWPGNCAAIGLQAVGAGVEQGRDGELASARTGFDNA